MKSVFEASSGLEAHMVLNLLEQAGINGHIEGEYLQGGIGELQAMNFVRVLVSEEDYSVARKMINEWESIQPAPVSQQQATASCSRLTPFLTGIAVGAASMYWILSN